MNCNRVVPGLIGLCFIFSFSRVQANQLPKKDFIEAKGRFVANPGDSLGLIKKQLLLAAFTNAISNALKRSHLDPGPFWEQYKYEFRKYFSPTENKLKKAYGLLKLERQLQGQKNIEQKVRASLTPKQWQDYQKVLRVKRLSARMKYYLRSPLSKVVKKYVVKRVSRSSKNRSIRYLRMEARVDFSALNKLYFKWVGDQKIRSVRTLFLSTHLNLQQGQWKDFGLEDAQPMVRALQSHWAGRIQKMLSAFSPQVVKVSEEEWGALRQRLDELHQAHARIQPIGAESNEDGDEEEREKMQILPTMGEGFLGQGPPRFEGLKGEFSWNNSLWISVKLNLIKVSEVPILNKSKFRVEGEVNIWDMKTGASLTTTVIGPQTHELDSKDQKDLSSKVGGLLLTSAQSPISSLGQIVKRIPLDPKKIQVVLKGYSHMEQLFDFQDLLQLRGSEYHLSAQIYQIEHDRVILEVSYIGAPSAILSLLKRLEGVAVGSQTTLSFQKNQMIFVQQIKSPAKEGKFGVRAGEGVVDESFPSAEAFGPAN